MPTRYSQQREKRTPPYVSLADVRKALGLTLDQVIARTHAAFPELKPTRGAVCAIEQGHRGASAQMLGALCVGYGLPAGSITTDYRPRQASAA